MLIWFFENDMLLLLNLRSKYRVLFLYICLAQFTTTFRFIFMENILESYKPFSQNAFYSFIPPDILIFATMKGGFSVF